MSNCAKCGRYFETSKQTDYCSECERPKISTCDMPLPGVGKQEGWICPVCGRGVAPWMNYCPCQSDWKITYGTGTTTDNEELNRLFELNDKRVAEMIEFENSDLSEG